MNYKNLVDNLINSYDELKITLEQELIGDEIYFNVLVDGKHGFSCPDDYKRLYFTLDAFISGYYMGKLNEKWCI
ncbi:MAG: hypothetical protein J6S67_19005 [Methanobrevibacter sp.]|nr:hypothetical protein [Methanobrevibacter sp.]